MRIGFALPNSGALATPEAVLQVARRAEDLGYDGLWTFESILYAVKPQNPYPGAADGRWPETFPRMLDPLDTLTFVASQTKKISSRHQRARHSLLQPRDPGTAVGHD